MIDLAQSSVCERIVHGNTAVLAAHRLAIWLSGNQSNYSAAQQLRFLSCIGETRVVEVTVNLSWFQKVATR
ncbi:MAG: hypothetical protein JO232_05080 [Verrucomicrobia bacterium]|nr:hypothetical protein [Verrucomicrobiota bacterium]